MFNGAFDKSAEDVSTRSRNLSGSIFAAASRAVSCQCSEFGSSLGQERRFITQNSLFLVSIERLGFYVLFALSAYTW